MRSQLEREIDEQPAALARLLERGRASAEAAAAELHRPEIQYILVASRGSSSNAARYAQYLLGRAHRVPVAFATPSLYTLYGQPPRLDGAFVIGISQSGESPDVVAVLEEARRQGRPTLALTNRPDSPLGGAADIVLDLEAGEERAVAATKTYVNSIGAVALLFVAATGGGREELEAVPEALERQLAVARAAVEAVPALDGGTVLARGVTYGTAFEIALKIRELSGLLFEAYSGADLMHGPVAAVAPGWPVVAVAPSGPTLEAVEQAIGGVAERGARVVVLSDVERVLARGELRLPLVPQPEWLSPFTSVVPGQLVALRLAKLRGVDVDHPLGLSKVTRTR